MKLTYDEMYASYHMSAFSFEIKSAHCRDTMSAACDDVTWLTGFPSRDSF